MPASLLPPNATHLERAVEAGAMLGSVDTDPAGTLWDPTRCPAALLPWLGWGLSVDYWDPEWPEATKRFEIARSIALHRIKGTRTSVEVVLARFDALLAVVEPWEAESTLAPHTFEVHLPLVTAPGIAPGGQRASAAFADAIIREVGRVKPLREHLTLVQTLRLAAPIGLAAVLRLATWQRMPVTAIADASLAWDGYLQTEDGEPFVMEESPAFLEHAP